MSKTSLLAQNDNLAIENLKQKVGRSVFDLSHSVTFPMDINGAILPICCIETVPSDAFEISCEALLRQLSSLKVPLFTNLKLNTAFYWCSNRLGWKHWERFMSGGRSGNETFDIPRMYNVDIPDVDPDEPSTKYLYDSDSTNEISYENTLHTYFGYSINNNYDLDEEFPIAFPFFDYQMICRDFYTDVDRLAQSPTGFDFTAPFNDWAYENLFPADDHDFRLSDGLQYKCGLDSSYGCVLDKIRYHNVRDDYFTTSKKAPMRGDAPTISIAAGQVACSINADNVDNDMKNLYDASFNSYTTPGDTLNYLTIDNHGELATASQSSQAFQKVSDMLEGMEIKANVGLNAQITAAELRLLSQLTVWQELNMLHKPYYNDFLNAHFQNVSVGDSMIEKPQYIGGTSQIIHINEILQTSGSDGTHALGTQGATLMSMANNYVGKFYCNDYGYIIGVAYVMPDLLYEPAVPRHFSRRTKEDYYSPEFANLSMQAILNKEIFTSNDETWNNQPWGYTGAFDEMRSIPNRIAGDLLNSSYTDLKAWVLRRSFANDNLPSMSTEFLSLYDNVDKTAWNVPSMPTFILQVANYVKAVRPMPYVAIPKAL